MKRYLCFIVALGIYFFASTAAAYAQVSADIGSIAIGGSVTGSTVIIGIPQEKVDELVRDAKRPLEDLTTQQRDNIVLLKEKLDLNDRQVRAALGILGENDIPPERLAAKLVEIAERFKDLQATASAQPGDDPKIGSLKANAQKAIEAGQLVQADALLADVEMEQRHDLDHLAVNAAETSARRGDLALTRLRYGEAAKHFANAAALVPPRRANEDKRISYLQKEASALYQQGDELGDNDALLSAIDRYNRLLHLTPGERVPLHWASTQNDLGNVLLALGQRESGTARLEAAITAYRDALNEWTRERAPLDWAMTQNNLGVAFWALGERESGTARLQAAVTAFRNVLKEWTRDRMPNDWAVTQNNLGSALMRLGERESGTVQLEQAVAAFRDALKENFRELMEREGGTTRLENAVVTCREALKEWTRERVPLQWATAQTNLGKP